MTSGARLAGAILLAFLATILGWLGGASNVGGGLDAGGLRWSQPDITEPSAIDSFVERIAASDLLPSAELRSEDEPQEGVSLETAEGLAELISASDLSAFVQRGDVWRLHAYRSRPESTVYQAGDTLNDGWVIGDIDADRIVLRRDGEERILKAFDPGDRDNEI